MSIFDRWRGVFKPNNVYYVFSSTAPTSVLNYTAKRLYETQDNLQAVVNYLSNSIAQLPLKVYTRNSETNRERDRDSVAAKVLYRPNNDQTSFEFIRGLMVEYFVFGAVYILVLQDADAESGWQLRIVPTNWVVDTEGDTVYAPDKIYVSPRADGSAIEIPRDLFLEFRTYSAGSPGGFISPISALRSTLQEQIEAGNFRRDLWSSSGRLNAQILRPKDVEPWDDQTRKQFVEMFRESWGSGGSKAGSIPLMEDGMKIEPFNSSFKEQEWAESVKLSRQSVAAAYGINPSLIWHDGTQTYASAKDNARALYADCLGPVIQMLQQRLNAFLLPMIGADPNTYVEFDFSEKLKGSFEERASILQSAVGGPWMTRNEARADNNLPPIEGGDELIVPLNVVEGGQASPTDTHMDEQQPMTTVSAPKAVKSAETKQQTETRVKMTATSEESENLGEIIRDFLKRQRKSVLPKIGAGADNWFDLDRWDKELADDIEEAVRGIADAHGISTAEVLGTEYIKDITREYIRKMVEGRSHAVNIKTRDKLKAAIDADEEPSEVYDARESKDAQVVADSIASQAAGWAIIEACHQAQAIEGFDKGIFKEWVTGPNSRPTHAAMNGQRVPIDDDFILPNGERASWPGDDDLSADESCGCNCTTEVIIVS